MVPQSVTEAIARLRARPIPATAKGFTGLREPVSTEELAARRPGLAEFSYPLMTLRDSALRNNIEGLAGYCAAAGVLLAPHGKTTMAPQLAARQLAAGAWGMSVAHIGQLRAFREFGFPRLFLANELVDRAGIAWLAGELAADPGFEAYCYVDSFEGVAILDSVLGQENPGRPLPVVVELGHADGRTGVRTVAEAVAVGKAVRATGTLELAGVAGYEGQLGHDDKPETLAKVTEYCRTLRSVVDELWTEGSPILSAGGSLYFDVVVEELTADWPESLAPRVILRSGAYVSHDHGTYHRYSPAERGAAGGLSLQPALRLWAQVVSRPEPGLALLTAGRRDSSFDEGMPIVLSAPGHSTVDGWEVTKLNDQHGYLRFPETASPAVGDLVCLGISHPCTAFDKWRAIPVLDDDDRVIDVVHTFF